MAMKYHLLADRLREELARNSGQSGYKLPTEQELSRQYRLSRQTVRHALSLLDLYIIHIYEPKILQSI